MPVKANLSVALVVKEPKAPCNKGTSSPTVSICLVFSVAIQVLWLNLFLVNLN
jgi:hypothetical protein